MVSKVVKAFSSERISKLVQFIDSTLKSSTIRVLSVSEYY